MLLRAKALLQRVAGDDAWSRLKDFSPLERHRIAKAVREFTEEVVIDGPFAGMRFRGDTSAGGGVAMLLGTYERELHGVVAGLQGLSLRNVVNVGAGDGYYSLGLLRLLPQVDSTAFESREQGRTRIRELAELNDVRQRVRVEGRCDVETLARALRDSGPNLVVCDVEGYEDELLDPSAIPALAGSYVLVELHDGKNEGVSERIRARFTPTHRIDEMIQTPRTVGDLSHAGPLMLRFGGEALVAAIDEGRPMTAESASPMSWYWMVPKDEH